MGVTALESHPWESLRRPEEGARQYSGRGGGLVLVVDDEQLMRDRLRILLERAGFRVEQAGSVDEAMARIPSLLPDVVLSDLKMPGRDGMELLAELRREFPRIPLIMVTGLASIEGAVAAMRAGAADYLSKSFTDAEVQIAVERTLEHRRLDEEVNRLRGELSRNYQFENIVTKNNRMQEIFALVRRVADTDTTILIEGETGTGKELIAQAIHYNSRRRHKAFHRANCGAFAETLLESELFGHERGAFTGADRRRLGIFELADGGTLLLDELENLSPAMQMKLLRVLETGELQRLGGSEVLRINVRVIGTSNRPLHALVEAGSFREDLYYRVSVIPISLPPLRDRAEDVPLLIGHFLETFARKNHLTKPPKVDVAATRRMMDFPWPGNVRQLRNLVERLVVTMSGPVILEEHLPAEVLEHSPTSARLPAYDIQAPLDEVRQRLFREVERDYIRRVLDHYGGHITKASAHLRVSRRTLYTKMRTYGLRRSDFR